MSDQTPQSNSQERHCMTLEEEIYQESLEVLSQMDDEEAIIYLSNLRQIEDGLQR